MTKIDIDIVSDAICPWCFIGKRRLERALADAGEDLEVRIGWRPFQLNPDMPREGMDRKAYLAAKFGGDARAKGAYRAVLEAGTGEGIAFDFQAMRRTPNTIDAHRLIDRAGRLGVQDQVVEGLFRAYFLDGRDIGDVAVLAEVAAAAGLDEAEMRRYLESDEDAERIAAEDAMARKMGINGVPCFIVNRKYAISGAQEPAMFRQLFEALRREEAAAPAAE
jgi:predicted DsbA family dithiol-disulfide isomerase